LSGACRTLKHLEPREVKRRNPEPISNLAHPIWSDDYWPACAKFNSKNGAAQFVNNILHFKIRQLEQPTAYFHFCGIAVA